MVVKVHKGVLDHRESPAIKVLLVFKVLWGYKDLMLQTQTMVVKDLKEFKDLKDYKDYKEFKDLKEFKGNKDNKAIKEHKDNRDLKDLRDYRAHRERKECKAFRETQSQLYLFSVSKGFLVFKDFQEKRFQTQESWAYRDYTVRRALKLQLALDFKVSKDFRETKGFQIFLLKYVEYKEQMTFWVFKVFKDLLDQQVRGHKEV